MPDLMTASLLFGGQVCIFLTAAIGVIQGLRNKQAIQEVHLTVNSRLSEFKETTDKLLAASVIAAHAEGVTQGRAEGAKKL